MVQHRFMSWAALTTLLLLLGVENAVGQTTIVIHDVTIIDGTGAPPRGHVDLVLRDRRMASIEDARTYTHPAGRSTTTPWSLQVATLATTLERKPHDRSVESSGLTTIVAGADRPEPRRFDNPDLTP